MNRSQATRSPQLQPPQVLFARQAIIDTAGRVRGYELLYRGRRGSHGEVPDAEHATCQVLAAAFAESGLGVAVGEVPAWINVSEHFLSAFDPPPLPPRITSVRHAITMLGLNAVRQWALVLLVGGIGERRGPLLSTALIRARTCELLAHARGLPFPDAFFSVGLLSVGDALTGRPLTEIVAELPLADSVASALTGHSGPMGAALAAAIACEQGLLPERDPGLTLACYDDAIAWADGLELV